MPKQGSKKWNASARRIWNEYVNEEKIRRGWTCEWPGCSETNKLVWHHVDPATKLYGICDTRLATKSWDIKLAELAKTKLVCEGHQHFAHYQLYFQLPQPWSA